VIREFFDYVVLPLTISDDDQPPIHYTWDHQYNNYHRDIEYTLLTPILNTYFRFTPSFYDERVCVLLSRYNIQPDKTCAVMYRGNDKCFETLQPSYDEVFEQTRTILKLDPDVTILVQTDEMEFLIAFQQTFPDAIYFTEIPTISKCTQSIQNVLSGKHCLEVTLFYVASIYIMSKCKHIVCTSGNGENFIALWRGHSHGIRQFSNGQWFLD
jgi:hypothetical protein